MTVRVVGEFVHAVQPAVVVPVEQVPAVAVASASCQADDRRDNANEAT